MPEKNPKNKGYSSYAEYFMATSSPKLKKHINIKVLLDEEIKEKYPNLAWKVLFVPEFSCPQILNLGFKQIHVEPDFLRMHLAQKPRRRLRTNTLHLQRNKRLFTITQKQIRGSSSFGRLVFGVVDYALYVRNVNMLPRIGSINEHT